MKKRVIDGPAAAFGTEFLAEFTTPHYGCGPGWQEAPMVDQADETP